jgi:hypothetical protein
MLQHRATIGANSVLGDKRWAGAYGIEADYRAEDNCKVLYLLTSDILVCIWQWAERREIERDSEREN